MDIARWPELEAHLDQLLTLPPSRRAQYLAGLSTQPQLQSELQRLLAAAENPEVALGRPAVESLRQAPAASAGASGQVLGAWRLLERVGSGGSGEVYRAERADGRYEQLVAVKLLRADAVEGLERFEMEQRILAQLEHPGIARLYDAGVTPDGRPYLVMEWVDGVDILRWCTQQAADLPTRLALFLQVCEAVSWAHRHVLVHRDIKPANVMVNAQGQVKLLDFGIAKQLLGHDQQTVNAPLTPAYAAPEQLAGGSLTTATDVYALGVMLFQMLTGRLPWSSDGGSLAGVLKRLQETPVPAPSRVATAESPVPARALRGDLDAIVGRALRPEAEARYEDARALADDLRRHLDHRPVQARSGARSYVLRRYLRRHWLAFATAATLFVAMAAALVAISWQARKAQLEAQRAEAVQAFMVDLFRTNSSRQPDPVAARKTSARQLLDMGAQRVENELTGAPENKLRLLRTFADMYSDLALVEEETRLRRQAVTLSRSLYGKDSTELVDDLVLLAEAMRDSTSMSEAGPVFDEARAILDRRKDRHSVQRGRLLLSSADYLQTSDFDRAFADASEAVALFEALPPSSELAEAYNSVAAIEFNRGDAAASIEPIQRAIAVSRDVEGAINPQLVVYYYQLALSQTKLRLYADAEQASREALRIAVAIDGEDHPNAMRARMMLSQVLLESGRVRESVALAVQTRDSVKRVLGPDEVFHRPAALNAAARAQGRGGELAQSLADSREALAAVQTQEPEGYPAASNLEEIAQVLVELGQRDEARRALEQALGYRKALGHPSRDVYMRTRIRLALDEGRVDEARQLLSEFAPEGKGEAKAVAGIRRQLLQAEITLMSDDPAQAAAQAAEAAALARASTQAPYLRLQIAEADWLQGLARLRGGDAPAAHALLSSALATRRELLLPKSPKIAEVQLALAQCDLAAGRRQDAAAWVAQAAAIEAQHPALAERYREPLQRLRAQLAQR